MFDLFGRVMILVVAFVVVVFWLYKRGEDYGD